MAYLTVVNTKQTSLDLNRVDGYDIILHGLSKNH